MATETIRRRSRRRVCPGAVWPTFGTILLLVLLCGSGGDYIVPGTNGQEPTQATTPPPKLVFTKVNLGGQLAGTTLEYGITKNDPRTATAVPAPAAAPGEEEGEREFVFRDTITIIYTVPERTWVSIGLNPDGTGRMIGASAVVGLPQSNEVVLYDMSSYALSGVVPVPPAQQTLIAPSIVQYEDDSSSSTTTTTILTFTKILNETVVGDPDGEVVPGVPWNIDLAGSRTTLLGAYGYDNMFFMHQGRESFVIDVSAAAVAATATEVDVELVETTRKKVLWQLHGWCAVLAWGVLAPLAIGAALLRSWFPTQPVGVWYKVHTSLNFAVIVLTLLSFLFAVVAIQQEAPPTGPTYHFAPQFPHRCIGFVVFVLVLGQGLNGHFRPAAAPPPPPSSSKDGPPPTKARIRTVWELSHRSLGMVLLGLSWYQIDSGIHLYQSFFLAGQKEGSINLSALFWGITGTLSGLILLCYGIIRRNNHTATKNKGDDNDHDHDNDNENANKDSADETPIGNQHEDDV